MRSYLLVFLTTASVALAACGGGSGRGPAAPSGVLSGPSSAVTSGGGAISWSCFTRAAGTGMFGMSDCPPLRAPAAPLRPATAAPIVAPGAPTNFTATVTGSTVVLNWTAPVGGDAPTSYSVQAGSTNGASDLANFDTGTTSTSLTVLNVPAGTYSVRIRANNSAGQSGPSNEFQVVVGTTTPCVTLNAPTGLSSTVTSTTVVLSWSAPAAGCAPTTYIIQAGSTVGTSNLANFSTGSTATTFTATGVAAGTYYVRVAAAIPGTLSAPSNEISVTVGPTHPQTVFASFQLFDPSTTGGPVTECRLRAPNNGSRLTCELRASAFTLGTASISSYSWLVRYTHGTPVEISRTDANPSLSFSDVCDAPDGVNGGTDDGVAQPLSVQLQVTNSLGASVTVASGVDQQPPLVIRLWNCGK